MRTERNRVDVFFERNWNNKNNRLAQLECLITKNYSNYANFFQTKSRLIRKIILILRTLFIYSGAQALRGVS